MVDPPPWRDRPWDALLLTGSAALGLGIPIYAVLFTAAARITGGEARPPALHFFPRNLIDLRPEPSEQVVFALALTFPIFLAASTWLLRNSIAGAFPVPTIVRLLAVLGQCLVSVVVLLSIYKQFRIENYSTAMATSALVAGLLVAAALAFPWRFSRFDGRFGSPALATAAATLCVSVTVVVALGSIFTDATVGTASPETWGHLPYTSEEFAAALNGATPLVDFTSQYTNVLPLLLEPAFAGLGGVTTGTFTSVMATLSCLALLSVYICFRTVAGPQRRLWAALLYIVFVAASTYPTYLHDGRAHDILTYPALMPMRYGIPLLLASLVAWAGIRPSWSRDIVVAAVAAIALVNNPDFGLPAFGAAWLASAVRGRLASPRSWRAVWMFPAAAALATLTFITTALVRSGQLPHLADLVYYPRQFAVSGFFMLPMPGVFGLHLVMFLTTAILLAMALVGSAVLINRSADLSSLTVTRTSTLVYVTTFALGAAAYYAGRSDIKVLTSLFCAWALSLGVFLAGAPTPTNLSFLVTRRRLLLVLPTAATLGGAVGYCLGAVSPDVAVTTQVARLGSTTTQRPMSYPDMEKFVSANTSPGENIVLVFPRGYSIARGAGVRNWFPFADPGAVVTTEQVEQISESLRSHGVTALFTSVRYRPRGLEGKLRDQHFWLADSWHGLEYWRSGQRPASGPSSLRADILTK